MASRFRFHFENKDEDITATVAANNQQEAKAKARLAIGNNDLALRLVFVVELEETHEPVKQTPVIREQGKVSK